MDPARAPIFVVGTGRSGTTLLRFMLCAHPRIYITHEASFYLWEHFHSRRAPAREYLEYYFQTDNFRWLRVNPDRVLAGLPDPLPRERIGEAYAAVMREKAAQYGRPRFGDKTPSHAGSLARIFADFPDARVIHIVRDPRGVAVSLARMPWASASLRGNAGFCEAERRSVAPYRDRVLQIRLEDLLEDGRATMGRVLDHVGEPWDDAVLDHPRHLPDKHDMPPFPWLEGATRERAPAGVPWASLSPVEVRLVERVARRCMAEHGYPPAPLDVEPSRLAVWWRGLRDLPVRMHTFGTYLRLALRSRDPRTFDSPGTRAIWRRLNPGSWSRYPGFEIPSPPPLVRGLLSPPDEPRVAA